MPLRCAVQTRSLQAQALRAASTKVPAPHQGTRHSNQPQTHRGLTCRLIIHTMIQRATVHQHPCNIWQLHLPTMQLAWLSGGCQPVGDWYTYTFTYSLTRVALRIRQRNVIKPLPKPGMQHIRYSKQDTYTCRYAPCCSIIESTTHAQQPQRHPRAKLVSGTGGCAQHGMS
jgi:hypothetical protein